MNPIITVQIPKSYRYTGVRRSDPETISRSVEEIAKLMGAEPTIEKCLVQFRWDKRIAFLNLHPTWVLEPDIDSKGFSTSQAEIKKLFMTNLVGAPQNSARVWEDEFKRNVNYVAVVPTRATLKLRWSINANHADFIRCPELLGNAQRDPDGPQGKLVNITYEGSKIASIDFTTSVILHWTEPAYKRFEGVIAIRVAPGAELPPYSGFVSIDFGNTNSTVAFMDTQGLNANEIGFVNFSTSVDRQDANSIDHALSSAVRLKTYNPPPNLETIAEALYSVGTSAIIQDSGALLLGGKGLLADPRRDEFLSVNTDEGERKIPKELPAELLLTSMLQSFYGSELGYPKPVAITYPTTFSDAEIDRTREAVFKALRRSTRQRTYLPTKTQPSASPIPLLSRLLDAWVPRDHMIDEATAAAFYFLYRDFIRGPGRMPAAYMEYPNGVNLLLYDCGGGTTDIALIHCRLKPSSRQATKVSTVGNLPSAGSLTNNWHVNVKVLGRTGHRDFGGDNITIATFKVLKACLASRLSGKVGEPLDWQNVQDADVPEWFDENYSQVSKLIPTNWMKISSGPNQTHIPPKLLPLQLSLEEVEARKKVTLLFWLWAEQVKKNLTNERLRQPVEGQTVHPFEFIEIRTSLANLICSKWPDRLSPTEVDDEITNCQTEDFELIRRRVDALISADIQKTIDAANCLIENRLQNRTRVPFSGHLNDTDLPPDSMVHWVYVVGKASYYQTIQESLKRLNVQSLVVPTEGLETISKKKTPARSSRDGRLRFEADVLKACVAGGAVLALRAHRNYPDIKIDFDHELSKRLPFTVGCDTAAGFLELYHENQKYEDLTTAWIQVHEEKKKEVTIWLYRKWPGQEGQRAESGNLGPWERFLRFDFKEPPVGPIKVEYGYETVSAVGGNGRRKNYILSDCGPGKRERVVGKEVGERFYISPPQRGNL